MKCCIIVVTEGMAPAELRDVHLQHATAVQRAVRTALSDYDHADIGLMPYRGLVLPVLPATP